jgi:hypothetical protein
VPSVALWQAGEAARPFASVPRQQHSQPRTRRAQYPFPSQEALESEPAVVAFHRAGEEPGALQATPPHTGQPLPSSGQLPVLPAALVTLYRALRGAQDHVWLMTAVSQAWVRPRAQCPTVGHVNSRSGLGRLGTQVREWGHAASEEPLTALHTVVATSKKNACVSLVFSFLYKVVQVRLAGPGHHWLGPLPTWLRWGRSPGVGGSYSLLCVASGASWQWALGRM